MTDLIIEDGNCVSVQKIMLNKGLENLKNLQLGNKVFYGCPECVFGSMFVLKRLLLMSVDLSSLEQLSFGNECCYSCSQFTMKSIISFYVSLIRFTTN